MHTVPITQLPTQAREYNFVVVVDLLLPWMWSNFILFRIYHFKVFSISFFFFLNPFFYAHCLEFWIDTNTRMSLLMCGNTIWRQKYKICYNPCHSIKLDHIDALLPHCHKCAVSKIVVNWISFERFRKWVLQLPKVCNSLKKEWDRSNALPYFSGQSNQWTKWKNYHLIKVFNNLFFAVPTINQLQLWRISVPTIDYNKKYRNRVVRWLWMGTFRLHSFNFIHLLDEQAMEKLSFESSF